MRYYGIHIRAISQEMLKTFILDMILKIINFKVHLHFPGTNELNHNTNATNYINGLLQDCSNAIAKALELVQCFINPLIYPPNYAYNLYFAVFSWGWCWII